MYMKFGLSACRAFRLLHTFVIVAGIREWYAELCDDIVWAGEWRRHSGSRSVKSYNVYNNILQRSEFYFLIHVDLTEPSAAYETKFYSIWFDFFLYSFYQKVFNLSRPRWIDKKNIYPPKSLLEDFVWLSASTRLTAHCAWALCLILYLRPQEMSDVHDTECPFGYHASSNIIKLRLYVCASDFHGLDPPILTRALQTLQEDRKAELIGDEGVKFF